MAIPKAQREPSESAAQALSLRSPRRPNRDARTAVPAEQYWAEATLDVLPEIVFVVDAQGIVKSWNLSAEQFFGLSKTDAIGEHVKILLSSTDVAPTLLSAIFSPRPSTVLTVHCATPAGPREATLTAVAVAAADESEERSIVFVHPHRTWCPLPKNGSTGGSIHKALAQERSEYLASNERFRHNNKELTRRLDRQSKEMETRACDQRAGTLYDALSDHRDRRRISESLHDNLAQLLVANQLNLARLESQLDNNGSRELLNRIRQVTADALDYARKLMAELSPPVLNERGLGPALGWLSGQFQRQGLRVDVSEEAKAIQLPESESVIAFEAVRQLLLNVVQHAGAGHARVTAYHRDSAIHIEVSDDGSGFDAAGLEAVSQRNSAQYGLSRIHKRIESIGGQFRISSASGDGTVGVITLPYAAAPDSEGGASPSEAKAQTASSQGEHHKVQVLVVDDHDLVRSGLTGMVASQEDMDVVGEAADGLRAIELVRQLHPDVVIMDVNMPRLGGVEATKRLSETSPETAVVGLSIWDDDEVRRSMLAAGARAFITKGGPSEELFAAIRQAVGGR